ncbi:unnamed protein product, partial [Rotaria magnacalcarata]
MKKLVVSLLVLIFVQIAVHGNHFYGGSINWSPINNTNKVEINSTVKVNIEQQYAWSRNTTTTACMQSTILSYGLIGDDANNTLICLSNATVCSRTNFTANISSLVPCTDYNTILDMSFGHRQTSIDVNVLAEGLVIGYTSSSDGWIPLKLGGGNLSLVMYL